MTRVLTDIKWRNSHAPNPDKDGKRDYSYLPDTRDRSQIRSVSSRQASSVTCRKAPITLKKQAPWEDG